MRTRAGNRPCIFSMDEVRTNSTVGEHKPLNAVIVQSATKLEVTIILDASSTAWRYFRVDGEGTKILDIHQGGTDTRIRCSFEIAEIETTITTFRAYAYLHITAYPKLQLGS